MPEWLYRAPLFPRLAGVTTNLRVSYGTGWVQTKSVAISITRFFTTTIVVHCLLFLTLDFRGHVYRAVYTKLARVANTLTEF